MVKIALQKKRFLSNKMTGSYFLSALTLGFLGSFHCIVMCGPIALMLPSENFNRTQVFTGRLIYNAGRILTYVLLGILFGMIGFAVAFRGLQKQLSIASGILILTGIIFNSINKNWLRNKTGYMISSRIRKYLKKLFVRRNYKAMFFIGMLNGLLPCGFVYLAIAGAIAGGSIAGGMNYMLLFGLGTMPLMLFVSMLRKFSGVKIAALFSKIAIPVALALGVFLIYRGTVMLNNECAVHSVTHVMSCPVTK
jgi:sulfite exporter TauE/SafE